jgi:hypothetical protein
MSPVVVTLLLYVRGKLVGTTLTTQTELRR